MEDGISFGVLESLFCMNESFHKAGLCLEALSKDVNFDRDEVGRYMDRIKHVRAATNIYVMGIIQKVEAEAGVSA